MFYYLTVALQVFCIYHWFKNRSEYYWIFIILFLPVLGSLAYLFLKVYNRQDVENIQKEVTTIINPTKKIRDLEKQLQFSNTFQNRVNLADALFEMQDYNTAIMHYKEALVSNFQEDPFIIEKLIECHFKVEAYSEVIEYAEKIKHRKEFQGSEIQFIYGLSLEKLNRLDEAEKELKKIDQRYSFYTQRLLLAKFLTRRDKVEEAKMILQEITDESQHMTKDNRRKYKATIQEVEILLNRLETA